MPSEINAASMFNLEFKVARGFVVDALGRRWNPALHPRDSKGRFIETGGVVRLWGGQLGKVMRALVGGKIEVQTKSGDRKVVPHQQVTMVRRPNGEKPTKNARLVADEDDRREDDPKRGDGLNLDDIDHVDDVPDVDPADEDDQADDDDDSGVPEAYTPSRETATEGDFVALAARKKDGSVAYAMAEVVEVDKDGKPSKVRPVGSKQSVERAKLSGDGDGDAVIPREDVGDPAEFEGDFTDPSTSKPRVYGTEDANDLLDVHVKPARKQRRDKNRSQREGQGDQQGGSDRGNSGQGDGDQDTAPADEKPLVITGDDLGLRRGGKGAGVNKDGLLYYRSKLVGRVYKDPSVPGGEKFIVEGPDDAKGKPFKRQVNSFDSGRDVLGRHLTKIAAAKAAERRAGRDSGQGTGRTQGSQDTTPPAVPTPAAPQDAPEPVELEQPAATPDATQAPAQAPAAKKRTTPTASQRAATDTDLDGATTDTARRFAELLVTNPKAAAAAYKKIANTLAGDKPKDRALYRRLMSQVSRVNTPQARDLKAAVASITKNSATHIKAGHPEFLTRVHKDDDGNVVVTDRFRALFITPDHPWHADALAMVNTADDDDTTPVTKSMPGMMKKAEDRAEVPVDFSQATLRRSSKGEAVLVPNDLYQTHPGGSGAGIGLDTDLLRDLPAGAQIIRPAGDKPTTAWLVRDQDGRSIGIIMPRKVDDNGAPLTHGRVAEIFTHGQVGTHARIEREAAIAKAMEEAGAPAPAAAPQPKDATPQTVDAPEAPTPAAPDVAPAPPAAADLDDHALAERLSTNPKDPEARAEHDKRTEALRAEGTYERMDDGDLEFVARSQRRTPRQVVAAEELARREAAREEAAQKEQAAPPKVAGERVYSNPEQGDPRGRALYDGNDTDENFKNRSDGRLTREGLDHELMMPAYRAAAEKVRAAKSKDAAAEALRADAAEFRSDAQKIDAIGDSTGIGAEYLRAADNLDAEADRISPRADRDRADVAPDVADSTPDGPESTDAPLDAPETPETAVPEPKKRPTRTGSVTRKPADEQTGRTKGQQAAYEWVKERYGDDPEKLKQIAAMTKAKPNVRKAASDLLSEQKSSDRTRPNATPQVRDTGNTTPEGATDERAVPEPDSAVLDDVPAKRSGSDEPSRQGAVLPQSGGGRGGSGRGRGDGESGGDEPSRGLGGDDGEASGDREGQGQGGSAGRDGVSAEGAGDGAAADADRAAELDAAQHGVTGKAYRPASRSDLAGGEGVDQKQRARENLAALRTLRALQAEGRAEATADEQATMAKWGGMGAIKPLWSKAEKDKDWRSLRDEFRALVPDDAEWEGLKDNAANAHYTDYSMVDAMWGALEELGFEGGNVLEPGSGLGNFIFRAPEGTHMHGIEVEPITAGISQYLSPQATIRNESFGRTRAKRMFDAVIGNVPFGNYRVYDADFNPKLTKRIHDHFIEKSLASVKPGGVMVMVTSAGTMDKADRSVREAIYKNADLLGSVRLPNGSHKDAAGTDVATDVLMFRVRKPGEAPGDDTWLGSSMRTHDDGTPVVGSRKDADGNRQPQVMNDYYLAHPEHVLGEVVDGGYNHIEVRGEFNADDLRTALENITDAAAGENRGFNPDPAEGDGSLFHEAAKRLEPTTLDVERPADGTGANLLPEASQETILRRGARLQGSLAHLGTWKRGRAKTANYSGAPSGKVTVTEAHQFSMIDADGNEVLHTPPEGQRDELARLLHMRDLREDLIFMEKTEADDTDEMVATRKALSEAYDEYVARYGAISRVKVGWRKMTEAQSAKYAKDLEDGADPDPDVRERVGGGYEKVSRTYPEMGGMRNDPSFWSLADLEGDYIEGSPDDAADWGEATRGAILSTRQMRPYERPETADTADDALALVEEKLGRIDLNEVARMLGLEGGERVAAAVLGDRVMRDHKTGEWVKTRTYLSSVHLRQTLRELEEAVQADPSLQRNIDLVRAAMPADKKIADIQASLGSTWMPTETFRDFMRETVGGHAGNRISLSVEKDDNDRNVWKIDGRQVGDPSVVGGSYTPDNRKPEQKVQGTAAYTPLVARWGTSRKTFQELVEHSLNNTIPVVYDTFQGADGKKFKVKNDLETDAAKEKLTQVENQFTMWLRSDPERAAKLEGIFNEQFRSRIPANFINSPARPFPGMNDAVVLDQHQIDGVTRGLELDAMGAAWEVGVGKTFLAGALYAERIRLGKSKKVYHTTPNHLVEQTAREFKHLYPDMKLLVVDGESMKSGPKGDPERNRRRTLSQMRDGDWDVVIVSESADAVILPDLDKMLETREEELAKKRAQRDAAELKGDQVKANKLTTQIKDLEAQIEKTRADLEAAGATGRMDFAKLGFDYIGVDESHRYKNDLVLGGPAGVGGKPSTRAQQMRAKIESVREFNRAQGRDHGVLLLSGTPVTNNTREFYVNLRMLRPDLLEDAGVASFDDFYSMFLEASEDIEGTVYGGTQLKVRDGFRIKNAGEMIRMWQQAFDVVKADDVGIERPTLRGGSMEQVTVEMTDNQQAYYAHLYQRYLDRPKKYKLAKGDDNALAIGNDGLLAAIDMRLLPDKELDAIGVSRDELTDEDGKIAPLAAKVVEAWKATRDTRYQTKRGTDRKGNPYPEHPNPGALQLIFSDVGVPGGSSASGFNLYEAIRNRLIAEGMAPDEVAFIHDAADRATMKKLTDRARSGQIKVLIGSSAKMATGLNVQDRLTHLWHLDTQKTPDVIEQRNGRAIRRGNQNAEVGIGYITTEGTSEAWAWSVAANKDNFLREFDMADMDSTVVGVPDDNAAAPLAQLKATAAKDPYMLEAFRAKKDAQDVERAHAMHLGMVEGARATVNRATDKITALNGQVTAFDKVLAGWQAITPGEKSNFSLRMADGSTHTKLDEAAAAFEAVVRDTMNQRSYGDVTPWQRLGSLGGADLALRRVTHPLDGTKSIEVGITNPNSYRTELLPGASIGIDPKMKFDSNMAIRLRNLVNRVPDLRQAVVDKRSDQENALAQAREVLSSAKFDRDDELAAARERLKALDAVMAVNVGGGGGAAAGDGDAGEDPSARRARLEAVYREAATRFRDLRTAWQEANGGVKASVKLGATKRSRRKDDEATANRLNEQVEASGVPLSKAPRKVRSLSDEEAAKRAKGKPRPSTRPASRPAPAAADTTDAADDAAPARVKVKPVDLTDPDAPAVPEVVDEAGEATDAPTPPTGPRAQRLPAPPRAADTADVDALEAELADAPGDDADDSDEAIVRVKPADLDAGTAPEVVTEAPGEDSAPTTSLGGQVDVPEDVRAELVEAAVTDGLLPGITADDVDRYTMGRCGDLALSVHEATGWPLTVVGYHDPANPDEPGWVHVGVMTPSEHFLDVDGLHSPSDVLDGDLGDEVMSIIEDDDTLEGSEVELIQIDPTELRRRSDFTPTEDSNRVAGLVLDATRAEAAGNGGGAKKPPANARPTGGGDEPADDAAPVPGENSAPTPAPTDASLAPEDLPAEDAVDTEQAAPAADQGDTMVTAPPTSPRPGRDLPSGETDAERETVDGDQDLDPATAPRVDTGADDREVADTLMKRRRAAMRRFEADGAASPALQGVAGRTIGTWAHEGDPAATAYVNGDDMDGAALRSLSDWFAAAADLATDTDRRHHLELAGIFAERADRADREGPATPTTPGETAKDEAPKPGSMPRQTFKQHGFNDDDWIWSSDAIGTVRRGQIARDSDGTAWFYPEDERVEPYELGKGAKKFDAAPAEAPAMKSGRDREQEAAADLAAAQDAAKAKVKAEGGSKADQEAAAHAAEASLATADTDTPGDRPLPAGEDETLTPRQLADEKYPLNPQQQTIADRVVGKLKNVLVRAKAGTGKTSTLEAIARRFAEAEPKKRIMYVCFNKTVQTEAEGRMPGNTESRTGHSLGYMWVGKEWTDNKVSFPGRPAKNRMLRTDADVARHLGITSDLDDVTPKRQAKMVLAALAKYANSADDDLDYAHFVDDEGVDQLSDLSPHAKVKMLGYAKKAWGDMVDPDGVVPVKPDHYRKMWALSKPDLTKNGPNGAWKGADVIFLDEAQDTPPVLAKVIADQKAQKIIVGDSDQQIYSFTGAINYLDQVEGVDADDDLPLTKSYRFGKNIADIGNRFLQVLGSKDRVIGGGATDGSLTPNMGDADAILTRTNGGMIAQILNEQMNDRLVGITKGTKSDLDLFLDSAAYLLGQRRAPASMHEELAKFDTWDDVTKALEEDDEPKLQMLVNLLDKNGGVDGLRAILDRVVVMADDDPHGDKIDAEAPDGVVAASGPLAKTKMSVDGDTLTLSGNTAAITKMIREDTGDKGLTQFGFRYNAAAQNWTITGDDATREAALGQLRDHFRVSATTGPDGEPAQKPDVIVVTAHKSKGLEWDRVKIGGDFPEPTYSEQSEKWVYPDDEELRLAYVAVTRAGKALDPGSLSWVYEHSNDNGDVDAKDAPEVAATPEAATVPHTPDVAPEATNPTVSEAPAAPARDWSKGQWKNLTPVEPTDLRVGDVIVGKRTIDGEHGELTVESVDTQGTMHVVFGVDADGKPNAVRIPTNQSARILSEGDGAAARDTDWDTAGTNTSGPHVVTGERLRDGDVFEASIGGRSGKWKVLRGSASTNPLFVDLLIVPNGRPDSEAEWKKIAKKRPLTVHEHGEVQPDPDDADLPPMTPAEEAAVDSLFTPGPTLTPEQAAADAAAPASRDLPDLGLSPNDQTLFDREVDRMWGYKDGRVAGWRDGRDFDRETLQSLANVFRGIPRNPMPGKKKHTATERAAYDRIAEALRNLSTGYPSRWDENGNANIRPQTPSSTPKRPALYGFHFEDMSDADLDERINEWGERWDKEPTDFNTARLDHLLDERDRRNGNPPPADEVALDTDSDDEKQEKRRRRAERRSRRRQRGWNNTGGLNGPDPDGGDLPVNGFPLPAVGVPSDEVGRPSEGAAGAGDKAPVGLGVGRDPGTLLMTAESTARMNDAELGAYIDHVRDLMQTLMADGDTAAARQRFGNLKDALAERAKRDAAAAPVTPDAPQVDRGPAPDATDPQMVTLGDIAKAFTRGWVSDTEGAQRVALKGGVVDRLIENGWVEQVDRGEADGDLDRYGLFLTDAGREQLRRGLAHGLFDGTDERIANREDVQGFLDRPTAAASPAPATVDVGDGHRQGEMGMLLAAGEQVRTASGRLTTPFPKGRTETDRQTQNLLRKIDQWLLDNAKAEAEARRMNHMLPDDARDMSPADKNQAESILFEPSWRDFDGNADSGILKNLVDRPARPARPTPEATPADSDTAGNADADAPNQAPNAAVVAKANEWADRARAAGLAVQVQETERSDGTPTLEVIITGRDGSWTQIIVSPGAKDGQTRTWAQAAHTAGGDPRQVRVGDLATQIAGMPPLADAGDESTDLPDADQATVTAPAAPVFDIPQIVGIGLTGEEGKGKRPLARALDAAAVNTDDEAKKAALKIAANALKNPGWATYGGPQGQARGYADFPDADLAKAGLTRADADRRIDMMEALADQLDQGRPGENPYGGIRVAKAKGQEPPISKFLRDYVDAYRARRRELAGDDDAAGTVTPDASAGVWGEDPSGSLRAEVPGEYAATILRHPDGTVEWAVVLPDGTVKMGRAATVDDAKENVVEALHLAAALNPASGIKGVPGDTPDDRDARSRVFADTPRGNADIATLDSLAGISDGDDTATTVTDDTDHMVGFVQAGTLEPGDVVHISGDSGDGTATTVTGHVLGTPEPVEVHEPGQKPKGGHRVPVGPERDGGGDRDVVLTGAGGVASHVERDPDESGNLDNPASAGEAVLLGGREADTIPTDRHGDGLFPGSRVSGPGGKQGVVREATDMDVAVRWDGDDDDSRVQPGVLTVDGQTRPTGWTTGGRRLAPGQIVHGEGDLMGTVEHVDGNEVGVLTDHGMQYVGADTLRVVGRVRPGDGKDGGREPEFDTPAGEEGADMRPLAPIAPDALPEDAAQAPVYLKPQMLEALNNLGLDFDAVTPYDVQQAALRLRHGMPVSGDQAQALADHLDELAETGGMPAGKARVLRRVSTRLRAAAGRAGDADRPDAVGGPKAAAPERVSVADVVAGDVIAVPDAATGQVEWGTVVVKRPKVTRGDGTTNETVADTTVELANGDRVQVDLHQDAEVYRLPDLPSDPDNITWPHGSTDATRPFTEPRVGDRVRDAADAVVNTAVPEDAPVESLDALTDHAVAALDEGADADEQWNSSRRHETALAQSGVDPDVAEKVRAAADSVADDVADEVADVIAATLDDAEPLPGESDRDAAERVRDRIRSDAAATVDVDAAADQAHIDAEGRPAPTAAERAVARREFQRELREQIGKWADALAAQGDLVSANALWEVGARVMGRPDPIHVERAMRALAMGRDPQQVRSLRPMVWEAFKRAGAKFLELVKKLAEGGRRAGRAMKAAIAAARKEWRHDDNDVAGVVDAAGHHLRRGGDAPTGGVSGEPADFAARVAFWRDRLPGSPAEFGRARKSTRLFRGLSVESLRSGRQVAAEDAEGLVVDRAPDGGPGMKALGDLAAVHGLGSALDDEVHARVRAQMPDLGDDPAATVREARRYADSLSADARTNADLADLREKAQADAAAKERRYAAAVSDAMMQVLAEQRPMGPRGAAKVNVEGRRSDAEEVQALERAQQYLPTDWLAAAGTVEAQAGRMGRYDDGTITVAPLGESKRDGGSEYDRSALMGLAEHMESVIPGLREAVWAYHWQRTADGAPGRRTRRGRNARGRLANLFPAAGLDRSQVTRQGTWQDPWMGQETPDGRPFWWPLGVAALFDGDAHQDDQLRKFMMGLLAYLERTR